MGLKTLFVGTSASIAGTVYGTIVVLSTIVAGEDEYVHNLWKLAEFVATGVVVLWLAHVYAHGLGSSLESGRRLSAPQLFGIARQEASIPLSAVIPVAILALGALAVVNDHTAVRVAIGIGVITLATQGVRYAQLEHLSRTATVLTVALDIALGLSIVALKAWVIH
jgi:hypothetical protein